MTAVDVVPLVDKDLGNSAYPVDPGDDRSPAVDAGKPLSIVRNPDQDPAELVWQARKVGYDNITGELDGGITAWSAAGEATSATPLITPATVGDSRVLDIRRDNEYAAGHLPGTRHIELGALTARADDLPTGPMVVMCGHSERAMAAAGLLKGAGRDDVKVLNGGPRDWADATGNTLETGK